MIMRIVRAALSGALVALAAGTMPAKAVRAEGPTSFYDAPAAIGADQAESLHLLTAGRLERLRSRRPGASRLPKVDTGGPSSYVSGDTVFDMIAGVKEVPIYTGGYRDFGVWSRGFGRKTGIGTSDGSLGFSSVLAGGSIGVDHSIGEHWVVGGMAAASSGEVQWKDDQGSGTAASGGGTLYASYFDRDMFLDMSLSAGWTRSSASLPAAGGFARTDITLGGRLDAGFDLQYGGLTIRPIASSTLITVESLEGGSAFSLGFDFGETRLREFRARLGVDLSRSFLIGDMALDTRAGVSWRRSFTMNTASAQAPDRPVRPVRKVHLIHGNLEPRVALTLQIADRWRLFTRYNGHFDAAGAERHTVMTGLRGNF